MDPDAALDTALNSTVPVAERLQAARNLRAWIHDGGYPPLAWSPRESGPAIGRIISKLEVIAHAESSHDPV